MPDAPVLGAGSTVKLDDAAFAARFSSALVHQSVRAEQAARRRGTAATKTRSMVSGGGVVFGPTPRHYVAKVNRKARRAALRSALSAHAGRGSLAVFDAAAFSAPSTSQAADLLADWGADAPTLVVLGSEEAAAGKSFRNIPRVDVMPAGDAGVADLIGAASLLVSQVALPELVARAGGAD